MSDVQMFDYTVDKATGATYRFETAGNVFIPTHTTQLLIQAARRTISRPGKLLDLGCGIGVCGLVLAKLGSCQPPVYLSDVSEKAAGLALRNAERMGLSVEVRSGSLFSPWTGERFDVILDDVSGVCEEIARFSPWFPEGVACETGRDGADLVVAVLEQADRHLAPEGVLLFPVLSLSNADRILETARARFREVSLVAEQSWFLPEELLKHWDLLEQLMKQQTIRLEQKFGRWLWSTQIYRAGNNP